MNSEFYDKMGRGEAINIENMKVIVTSIDYDYSIMEYTITFLKLPEQTETVSHKCPQNQLTKLLHGSKKSKGGFYKKLSWKR